MTEESAAFVLGFSLVQVALARAAGATISKGDAVAKELHLLQAHQMLTFLRLNVDLAAILDLDKMRRQAEVIFPLLQTQSTSAGWSFRLGCDLGALGTAQYLGIRSEYIEFLAHRFDEDCRESGVPFDLARNLLWASADTSLTRPRFVERVSEAMNHIAEFLEGPELRTTERVQ